MINKNIKIALGTLLISSSVWSIYKINSVSKQTTTIINSENKISSNSNTQDKNTTDVVLQKLTVLGNKCRGCGRCVRIDPEHFEINQNTRKAIVISGTNLQTEALSQAINNCPAGAISLS